MLTALFWSFLERFGIKGITLLFSVFLARILTPDDYGIVAMPMIFLAVAQCLIDCGFGSALIRKQDLKEEDLNTAFLFNIGVGLFCYILLFIASPWIAQFYKAPILADLLKVSALSTLTAPFCLVQNTLLTREVDFKRLAKISLATSLGSGFIGLGMALAGYGVWSLVVQSVGGQLIRIVLLWHTTSWRPRLQWAQSSFRYLWGFGSKMMAAALINVANENVFPMILGRFFSPALLGNFMKGSAIASLPSLQATDMLQRVTYPVLCKMQGDDQALASHYRKLLRLSAFVIFPLMVGLAAAAQSVVDVLLGEQWDGVVIILQLLSLGMMLYPIHAINLNLLQVKGRSDLFLLLDIIKAIVGLAVLIITVPRGILWMVASVPVLSVLALVANTYFTGKMIQVGLFRQLQDLTPILFVSLLMGSAVWGLNQVVGTLNPFILLPILLLVGVALYTALSYCFLQKEWKEAQTILHRYLNRTQSNF